MILLRLRLACKICVCASLWNNLKENKTEPQPPNTKDLLPRNGRNSTIPSSTLHVVSIDWHQQWTRQFRGCMVTEQSGSLETSRRTSTFGWHVTQGTRGLQTQGCGARRLKELPSTSVVWGDVWRGWTWNWGQEWFGKGRRHSTLRDWEEQFLRKDPRWENSGYCGWSPSVQVQSPRRETVPPKASNSWSWIVWPRSFI